MLNLHNAEFVRSAVRRSDFPNDPLPQIVFAGKSNVGKSSTINKLLNRKNFARVGNEPGKTIHINFFCIDQKAYFVDLPGYGYAKVSKKERDRWGALMEEYFAEEDAITLGFQIVDARHKPTADDVVMADWFLQSGVPFAVIANKHDKLKKSAVEDSMNTIRTTLHLPEDVPVIPFSAVKGTGRDEVLQMIFDHVSGSQP
ncbi:MAG: ribosome biogenesis GTP-binding protein YihA/YsxC [Butyricicoccus sp.]|jgi:GTP-binding protein|nr:ribosome biogenesis GTP-binding protein YihA/YsxC [Clostridiales bacterium]